MHGINCTDETFDPNFTIEYKLSIQVGLDGFSFCILDDIRKKYLVLKHFPFHLSNPAFLTRKVSELLTAEEIFERPFKEVKVLIDSPHFSVTPNVSGFNQSPESFLRQNFNLPFESQFGNFNDDFFGCSVGFAYPKNLQEVFSKKFEKLAYTHQLQPAFRWLEKKSEKNTTSMLVNVSPGYFSILVSEDKHLLFANSFTYKNQEDFMYYLLTCLKSLSLDLADLKLYVSGHLEENSHIHKTLIKHIEKIHFVKLNTTYQYSYTFDSFPPHKFSFLINPEG